MEFLVPPINTQGTFKFSPPFNTRLSETEPVKVVAIKSLIEMKDEDPLTNIYTPVGLSESDMIAHIENDVPVISFLRQNGDYVYVPAEYINEAPPIVGVVYQQRLMIASLGLLPESYDFDLLRDDIIEFIKDRLGIVPNVELVKNSAPTVVDTITDKILEEKRNSNSSVNKSYLTRFREVSELNDALILKNDELEAHIINQGCCTAVAP